MRLSYIVVPPSRIRLRDIPRSCASSPRRRLSRLTAVALATAATTILQTHGPAARALAVQQHPQPVHATIGRYSGERRTPLRRTDDVKPQGLQTRRRRQTRLGLASTLVQVPQFPSRPSLTPAEEAEIITRMLVAVVVGATIGVERRAASASAGVRTLTLVSLGSAIFSLTALHGLGGDPARMGAAISTGIGFLGSGAINGQIMGSRRQLVTAASIWVAAALGVAAATGLFTLAITGAFVTIWILRWRLLFALLARMWKRAPWKQVSPLSAQAQTRQTSIEDQRRATADENGRDDADEVR